MVGNVFGRLTVVERGKSSLAHKTRWICRCSCGNVKLFFDAHLKSGHTKSCGCLRAETTKNRFRIHGKNRTPLYIVWMGMKRRCCDEKHKSYAGYGARGIRVCEEWSEYINFHEWSIENGYKKGLKLDRKNNDGNYEPDNCRFVTNKVNANNKRNNRFITIGDETKTISQWSDFSGINQKAIQSRIKYGWTGERLIEPINRSGKQYRRPKENL